jgi:hypothetical protein
MISIYLYGLWNYLNQPLFNSTHPVQLNLKPFLQQQQIKLLKDCWQLETLQDNLLFEHHPNLSLQHQIIRLERCWNLTKQHSNPTLANED